MQLIISSYSLKKFDCNASDTLEAFTKLLWQSIPQLQESASDFHAISLSLNKKVNKIS
jgi:hypothetical protein